MTDLTISEQRAAALRKLREAKANVKLAEIEIQAVQIRCQHIHATEHKCGDYSGDNWTECRCGECGLVKQGTLQDLHNDW